MTIGVKQPTFNVVPVDQYENGWVKAIGVKQQEYKLQVSMWIDDLLVVVIIVTRAFVQITIKALVKMPPAFLRLM